MNKVYLYSRVSTDNQSLAQQERTALEWLKNHQMKVDKVVSDEGVSGGVSYANRNLGRVLLPMVNEGDMIIVSEISRLGRSMFDLNLLIHNELKPRKIRLVVVSMGIDLRCDKLTAIDELILNNFSFAAQLEKQLISERTLSALQVKKSQGVKLGGAASKWRKSYNNKTKEEKYEEYMKRGKMKNERHLASRDVQAFLRILKSVFQEQDENPTTWNWSNINTKGENKEKLIELIKSYRDIDESGTLFRKWEFEKWDDKKSQIRLAAEIYNIKKSIFNNK